MKALWIGLMMMMIGTMTSYAETVKVGIYSQVGSVTEFCNVNSAYVFINGIRTKNNAMLGKIFYLTIPVRGKLVLVDASAGRGANECDRMVIEKEDGSEIKIDSIPGTTHFEVGL